MIASNNASRLGDRSWIKSASTPSPWFAEETADGYRITASGKYVARVHSEPDALLVAAAPQLRAVVAAMYCRMTTGSWAHVPVEDKVRWIEMLRSVLTDAGLEPPPEPEQPRAARAEQGELFA